MDAKLVEKVSRAVCIQGGHEPDEGMPNGGPRWKYYAPGSQAAIAAVLEHLSAVTPEIGLAVREAIMQEEG